MKRVNSIAAEEQDRQGVMRGFERRAQLFALERVRDCDRSSPSEILKAVELIEKIRRGQ